MIHSTTPVTLVSSNKIVFKTSDVLPFPSAAATHLSPYFSRETREIYGVTDLTGALPLKRGSIFHSFPPLFHSSIYTELFLS